VEDTPVTLEEVRAELGEAVAALVADLTDVSRPSDGSRAAREAVDR
jgi:(p)ppGpp synthase/HD superfamily hydrolase